MSKIAILCDSDTGVEKFTKHLNEYFLVHVCDEGFKKAICGSGMSSLFYFTQLSKFTGNAKKKLWADFLRITLENTGENGESFENGALNADAPHYIIFDIFQKDTIKRLKDEGAIIVKLKNLEEGVILKSLNDKFGHTTEEEISNLTLKVPDDVVADYTFEFNFSDEKQRKRIILQILNKLP